VCIQDENENTKSKGEKRERERERERELERKKEKTETCPDQRDPRTRRKQGQLKKKTPPLSISLVARRIRSFLRTVITPLLVDDTYKDRRDQQRME
jgi:hypothetical protein